MASLILRSACWQYRLAVTGKTLNSVQQNGICLRSTLSCLRCKIPGQVRLIRQWTHCQKGIFTKTKSTNLISMSSFMLIPVSFNPLAFLRSKQPQSPELSKEILANIPKEVFKKDVLVRRKRRYRITKLLLWIWGRVRFWGRLCRVILTFTPLLLLYPLTYLGHGLTVLWRRGLLRAMENLGPTFIKLGQWAATRQDLFSPEFCSFFYKLHDSAWVHSWYMTKRKLKKAFGKRWQEIFVHIEKTTIGSGCIAQVHRAYMRTDMIPDELLVEECLDDIDSNDDSDDIDFAEGLEIMGFGRVQDKVDQLLGGSGDQGDDDIPTTAQSRNQTAKEASGGDGIPSVSEIEVEYEIPDTGDDDVQIIPVAVKVLHPGMYRIVSRDLAILRMAARVVEWLVPSLRWLSLQECLAEFSTLMTKQIDLRFEADCMDKFGENFEEIPYVRFPRTVRPYCKRDVIVETLEEGERITNFLRDDVEVTEGLREKLAVLGAEALLKMIFVDNLVHGDLHPGNILVQNADAFVSQDENKLILVDMGDTVLIDVKPVETPLRLVLLDTGITTSLTEKDRQNFRDVFSAVVMGEGERVAELMLEHARYSDCKDVEGFKAELSTLVNEVRSNTVNLGKIDVGSLLSNVFSILSRHKIKMESHFASVLLAIFVLEGLGRSLDQQLDLLELAKPFLLS